MAITLKDTSSLRYFKLEKLTFGYMGSDNVPRAIDHKVLFKLNADGSNTTDGFFDYGRWDNDKKHY